MIANQELSAHVGVQLSFEHPAKGLPSIMDASEFHDSFGSFDLDDECFDLDDAYESGGKPPIVDLTRDGFRWRTMEGDILTLAEMETRHIFNCFKMCFNHLAAAWGGKPVWFTKKYKDYAQHGRMAPQYLAALVVFFMEEIDRRGDLAPFYLAPYQAMVNQITPIKLPGGRFLLNAPSGANSKQED